MAHHHLAVQAHAGADETKLPVAVRRLVGVHKVHVDVGPRNVAVELRVQVRQRLLQDFQPVYPHFSGGKRVHPGNQAHAIFGGVGLLHELENLLRTSEHRLVHHFDGQLSPQLGGNLLGVLGYLLQRFGAVEVLAAGDEPGFVVGNGYHGRVELSEAKAYTIVNLKWQIKKNSSVDSASPRYDCP